MCDVNNDGLLDVAVATYAGEVRTPAEGERQTERVEGLTESQQVRERERDKGTGRRRIDIQRRKSFES
jgi:hypothetical protein